jgi:hypothetical protein
MEILKKIICVKSYSFFYKHWMVYSKSCDVSNAHKVKNFHAESTMICSFITQNQTSGLDINVCPIPVKTDVGQVDLLSWLSDGTSAKMTVLPFECYFLW